MIPGMRVEKGGLDRGKDAILVVGVAVIVAVLVWNILHLGNEATDVSPGKPTSTTQPPKVRSPAVAGQFYPADKGQLESMVDGYLSGAPAKLGVWGVRGLVSPHAGYVYSGPVAAYGYRQLEGSRYGTVIVLGPSHKVYLQKAYIPDVDYYETPLGRVPVSPVAKELLRNGIFTSEPAGADSQEHSVEAQVPFLQRVLPPFKIVPVMVGDVDPGELADALSKYVDDDTLVVASTDLSHYKPYGECVATDNVTVSKILALDYKGVVAEGDACGKIPVLTLMELAKRRGWRTTLFDYRNSGDTAGSKDQGVVGYASIGFYDGLDREEAEILIGIAKSTLAAHYGGGLYVVNESQLPPKLSSKKACFVTLNENRRLRGCIGHLVAQGKLYECVQENALNAALNDGRFEQVDASELPAIKVEVSVLTDPKPLPYDGQDDLLAKLIPGVDGVILKSGSRQSTYLPVVWEMLPGKEEFLKELCLKQGSPGDCWKTAEVLTYQAQEFHEDGFK